MGRLPQISIEDIRRTARQQMAAHGSAGLTLRGIARELNVTAPAIYNYYPSLSDLITALIVDAFTACAEALETADASEVDYGARLAAVMSAYRRWALANTVDFQLIYGDPIPGYVAPRQITLPAAVRAAAPFTRPLAEAALAGVALHVTVPAAARASLRAVISGIGVMIPEEALYAGTLAWTRAHGAVVLELHGHLTPVVGDGESYLNEEVRRLLHEIMPHTG